MENDSNKNKFDENGVLVPNKLFVDEGVHIQTLKDYGCGVDVHRDFIQVSVIILRNMNYFEYQREFKTTWDDVCFAKQWVINIIENKSNPVIKVDPLNFHYCLESTASYHTIVLKSWEGLPELINPQLAGATLKKTDVADASKLARMNLSGIWRTYYVPSDDVTALRLLIAQRNQCKLNAQRCSNRINSILLHYGITVGRNGSVTKSATVRDIVMDIISNKSQIDPTVCPTPIPDTVKEIIIDSYNVYDENCEKADEYLEKMLDKCNSLSWEYKGGLKSGKEIQSILTSIPGIGPITATIWLANVITPLRFRNDKACASYCGLDPSVQISAKHVTGRKIRKGNKDLHTALTMAASNLIKNHSEPIGKWGYMQYIQSGRWRKAVHAVARRLVTSMYYVHLYGQPFSYEKYTLTHEVKVIDLSVDDLVKLNPEFNRYLRLLKENNIDSTTQLIKHYYAYDFSKIKGFGKKFYCLVNDFISNQKEYRAKYNELEKE